ncbi:MAG: hypothetical protein NTZ27_05480 [Ignavibacteriales bacterium]|nr:hypothetical protein [Ignavibacteriales bacterium]
MNSDFIANKRNKLFLLTLIVTVVFIICSSFSLALDSTSQEKDIKPNSQNEFSNLIAYQIENNLSSPAINNIDMDSYDYDLLDYDDYVKPHRIQDRANSNLHIDHLPGTFITRKTFLLNNMSPQYPPIEKVIRLKNFLI